MAFFFDYIRSSWQDRIEALDANDLKNWQGFLKSVEDDRRRE
jgi:hypothetical protein